VVQDQLKVSGGWVRCGRCNEVFNALEGLYEIFTQPPEHGVETRSGAERGLGVQDSSTRSSSRDADVVLQRTSRSGIASPPARGAAGSGMPADAPPSEMHAAPKSALDTATPGAAPSTEPAPWDDRPAPGFEDVETRLEPRTGDETGPTPSFMQHAAARGRRLSRRQRRAWGAAAFLLAVVLAAQLAIAERDTLAAKLPALRPALAAACALAGCRVEAPRSLAALAVEGSNLRQRSGDGAYELVVALRNRSASAVMVPAFELTLTDSQGQALIRRVFSGTEMGAPDGQLPGGAEWNLQTALEVADRRIAGYTVEIFYP